MNFEGAPKGETNERKVYILLEAEIAQRNCQSYSDRERCVSDWLRSNSEEYNRAIDRIKAGGVDIVKAYNSNKDSLAEAVLAELEMIHN